MRERTPLHRALIEKLPNLKLVITTGMQNASVDAAALAERGIVFCGTDGVGHSTAELTWGLIICPLSQHPARGSRAAPRPLADPHRLRLKGKTLGIIGLGRLGSMVAGYGKAFGMEVIGWSRSFERCARHRARHQACREGCDFRAVRCGHHPRQPERQLARSRRRGRSRPHEADRLSRQHLARADRRSSGAARRAQRPQDRRRRDRCLTTSSPSTKGHPFFELDNVIVTPHLGYVIEENMRINYQSAVENIRAFLDGKPIRLVKPRN